MSDLDRQGVEVDKAALKRFLTSAGLFRNFMKRRNVMSARTHGQVAPFTEDQVNEGRSYLRRNLVMAPIQDIYNTDEVAVFYRSFRTCTLQFKDATSSFELVKACLNAVLTVFSDGTKAPLTIIGNSKRRKSFPRHFDALKDLKVFFFSQSNACNTQPI